METFLRYTLVEQRGVGGSAQVWRAATDDGNAVAIKLFGQPEREETFEVLRGEAGRLARLNHRRILRVYDAGALPHDVMEFPAGTPYLAMEFVDGPTVDLVRVPGWEWLRSITLQLLDALAAAHARNVVHLDIKPTNVLLRSTHPPDVVLADFGIAQRFEFQRDHRGDDRPFAGTPAYMAPEQIRKQTANFGPWTDVYALGCMVVQLCTGAPPFGGPMVEVLRKHLEETPSRIAPRFAVPEDLDDWLQRCLAKHTADRFQRAADAAWALGQLSPEVVAGESRARPIEGYPTLVPDAQTITWVHEDLDYDPIAEPLQNEDLRAFELPQLPSSWLVHRSIHETEFAPFAQHEQVIDRIWAEVRSAVSQNVARGVLLVGATVKTRYSLLNEICTRVLSLGVGTYLLGRPEENSNAADRVLSQLVRLQFFDTVVDLAEYVHGMVDAVERAGAVPAEVRDGVVAWACDLFAEAPREDPVADCELLVRFFEHLPRTPILMLDRTHEAPEMLRLAGAMLDAAQWWGTGAMVLVSADSDDGPLTAFAAHPKVSVLSLDENA